MANPYVNKVVTGDGRVLIDLIEDTITAADAVVGVTLHLSDGRRVTGTLGDFEGSAHGLVPASGSGDQDKFLKGDGSWSDIDAMTNTEIDAAFTAAGLKPAQ